MTLEDRLSAVVAAIRDKIVAMMPRLIPAGGTTGQALVKSSSSDYAASWQTVSGGGAAAAMSIIIAGKTRTDDGYILIGAAPNAINFTGTATLARCGVAPTSPVQLYIRKTAGLIGYVRFEPGSTVGVSYVPAFSVVEGDLLYVETPNAPDATLADISIIVR